MTRSDRFWLIALLLCLAAQGLLIYADKREGPRLIAHDCDGAGGDLWAAEESDFPTQCKEIERW